MQVSVTGIINKYILKNKKIKINIYGECNIVSKVLKEVTNDNVRTARQRKRDKDSV